MKVHRPRFSNVAAMLSLLIWLGGFPNPKRDSGPGLQVAAIDSSYSLDHLISVGANVQVSEQDKEHIQTEGLLAASSQGSNLLGCTLTFNQDSDEKADIGIVTYHSSDAGGHWRVTFRSKLSENAVDPACAYGPDDTGYLVFVPTTFASGAPHTMRVYRSVDGAEPWTEGGMVPVVDREYITVDRASSKYAGRVYVHGEGETQAIDEAGSRASLKLWRSEDGGRTFLGPVVRIASEHRRVMPVGNSIVLSDGTWLAVVGDVADDLDEPKRGSPSWLSVVRSGDGGQQLEDPIKVERWAVPWPPVRSSVTPYLATDPTAGPFKDRAYIVWPSADGNSTEIRFAYSTDEGKTWSKSIVLNDRPANVGPRLLADAFMPVIAVNSTGIVGVAWYDRSESTDGLGWHVRFTASLDGGETWLPSVRVSDKPMEFSMARTPPLTRSPMPWDSKVKTVPASIGLIYNTFPYTGGDTSGMAADATGTFHPYWVDNRTGSYQVWSAPVRVAGSATRNGDQSLIALTDVTDAVSVSASASKFDAQTGLGTLTVALRNISNDTLNGPIKLRLLHIESELAIITVQNADNGVGRGGAIWDLSRYVPAGGLAPGDGPVTQDLRFRASSMRPLEQGPNFGDFKLLLTNLTMRVYAQRRVSSISR